MMLCTMVALHLRSPPGGQRRTAGPVHHPGPLRGLETTAWGGREGPTRSPASPPRPLPAAGRWTLLFHGAMGLGFLCKGPIVVLIVGVTVIPYLAMTGRLRSWLEPACQHPGAFPVPCADPLLAGSRPAQRPPCAWGLDDRDRTEDGDPPDPPSGAQPVLGLALPLLALPWPVVALAGLIQPFGLPRVRAAMEAIPRSGSRGGGRSATWSSSVSGRWPSRITTCPACPVWPCCRAWPGSA